MEKGTEKLTFLEENSLRYCGVNPLLIPHVLQTIFQEFSYEELKVLRLVCWSWEYEASSILRSRTQIRFPSESHVKQYMSQLSCNYCCGSYEFNADIPLDSPTSKDFFSVFGLQISFLKLHQTDWTGEDLWDILETYFENLKELSIRIHIPSKRHGHFQPKSIETLSPLTVSLSSNNLPKLHWLKVNFSIEKQLKSIPPPPPDVTHPKILYELFQAFPNIEELSAPNWPVFIPPKTDVSNLVFNVILDPETPELKLNRLSKIHINASLTDMQLFQLMEKHFPLAELRLDINPEMKGYALYFLLHSLDNTLKTLILTFRSGGYEDRDFDDFPTLKNLRYLALHQYIGPIDFVLKNLPGLKTLLLNDVILEQLSILHQQHCGMEELIFEGRNFNALAQLYILSKMFPRLKKLRAENVDDTMLRVIFIKLPLLEVLHADGNFTNEGVSGIENAHAENIFEVEDVESVRIYPYIGRLKYLRKLVLSSNRLTYLAVLLGVNDCKSLKIKRIHSDKILPSLTNSQSSKEQLGIFNYKSGMLL